MSATQKVMGHVYAIFTILVWGSCFVLTKQMLTAYTAIQIIPLRMGLAYITLWALRPKTLKLPWKDELMFILIGVTGGSFYFFLQNTALTYTFAANVSIIIALSPILTVILAQLFSRNGERLGKFVYIGAVIAIAGVVLVVLNGQLTFHLNPLAGGAVSGHTVLRRGLRTAELRQQSPDGLREFPVLQRDHGGIGAGGRALPEGGFQPVAGSWRSHHSGVRVRGQRVRQRKEIKRSPPTGGDLFICG